MIERVLTRRYVGAIMFAVLLAPPLAADPAGNPAVERASCVSGEHGVRTSESVQEIGFLVRLQPGPEATKRILNTCTNWAAIQDEYKRAEIVIVSIYAQRYLSLCLDSMTTEEADVCMPMVCELLRLCDEMAKVRGIGTGGDDASPPD